MPFNLNFPFKPTGDQPLAIKKLVENIKSGSKHQVFLGVTGSGKTFSLANVIAEIKKPTLIISPNKTLAAQLYQEFKEFFPDDPVHYFVSYYDYYQPEAYIPQTDTYIEKDASINQEIDKLRHQAVQDLLSKRRAIIVASVSCIYNLGSPETYQQVSLSIRAGQKLSRKDFLSQLVFLQYQRNDIDFKPGVFRVRGDLVEVFIVTGKEIARIEFSNDKISGISISPPGLSSEYREINDAYNFYPAKFWVTPEAKLKIAVNNIRLELQDRLAVLKKQKKLLEAERLEQRTGFDLQMMMESGYCHGIENYSRHLEFRKPAQPPFTLLDYFSLVDPSFLVFIDESHLTCSQIKAMAVQDQARKKALVEYGFRLPSALDNRPLSYQEFEKKSPQITYVSATPSDFEKRKTEKQYFVEQLIRPTGLLEPEIEIKPTSNQIEDLVKRIKERTAENERVLVLTLTKRLAEDLDNFLANQGIRSQWLHSETKTMERPKIIENLREGKINVLIGVNLLREGLDLPEVSLVAILDADKEGFLRSPTTLIQTMGRAARHLEGKAVLYADKITASMALAIKEIERRKKIQSDYNLKHRILPRAISKKIRNWPFAKKEEQIKAEFWAVRDVALLEREMKQASDNLDFERAAKIRDVIKEIGH